MLCPRCDDQGLVYKAKIADLDIKLNICDECDACWLENQAISRRNFKDLATLLEEHGLTYENSKIEDLGYLDPSDEEKNRTFFSAPSTEIIALIDEAWVKKGDHLFGDMGAYLIDMQRVIGTAGETAIKIIVKPGTAEIRTAYPVKING